MKNESKEQVKRDSDGGDQSDSRITSQCRRGSFPIGRQGRRTGFGRAVVDAADVARLSI